MSPVRTPEQELARFRGRLAVAGVVALVCFGLLVARFFYLQVLRYDYYSTRAEDETVVVTAGASAPEAVVEECLDFLKERYQADVEARIVREEDVYFPLPRELRNAAETDGRLEANSLFTTEKS